MTPTSPGSASSNPRPPAGGLKSTAPAAGGTLDLLMDMEMPVLVRFASTPMLLHDLLALDAGSVVEFRRTPDDPVDILVNGRVVARGAVVEVQGNYGVRIMEITSQEGLVEERPGRARIEPRGN